MTISRTAAARPGLLALFMGAVLLWAAPVSADGAAVGLIKEASPGLPVNAFEQVTMGQTIPLGDKGHLVISYFASCMVETIDGGTVAVGSFGSRVTGGRIAATQDTKSCKTAEVATTTATAESGAAIERVIAFDPRDWSEATVSVFQPVFQSPASLGASPHLRILMLDDPQPRLIWEGKVKALPAKYPANAPQLQIGKPYKVELVGADGSTHSATFSIDPGYLSDAGTAATTVLVSP
jgi:hypothetical protein